LQCWTVNLQNKVLEKKNKLAIRLQQTHLTLQIQTIKKNIMENQGLQLFNGQNLKKDNETGLTIFGNQIVSRSGFEISNGFRMFENLVIVESKAKGVGVEFLSGIKIFDKNGKLIIDKSVEKGTRYDRGKVLEIVKSSLLRMLSEASASNPNFDICQAEGIINEKLKSAYFKESYEAITNWYNELLSNNI